MRKLFVIFLCLCMSLSVFSKRRNTGLHKFHSDAKDFITIGVGANYMFADVGGAKFENLWFTDWDVEYTRPTVSINYQHDFNDYVGLRGMFMYNAFAGHDENSRNEIRRMEYSSNTYEISLQGIFYFYRAMAKRTPVDLYAYVGFGHIWWNTEFGIFDAAGNIYKNRHHLQHVSKQDTDIKGAYLDKEIGKYKFDSGAFAIPFGIGVRFPITQNWYLGGEFGWRYLLGKNADFLDGFQTPWSKMNDTYATLTFSVGYRITGTDDCYSKYGRSQFRFY